MWIGRTDLETEGTWTNVLGEPVSDYTNWDSSSNQPDNYNGNEHCLMMNFLGRIGKWADFDCNFSMSCFPCQLVEECSEGFVFTDGKCVQRCPVNWTLVNDECIQIFCGEAVTWHGASDACLMEHAILAPINNAETNKMVKALS